MKYRILLFIIFTVIIINCFSADILFAQTIVSIDTSDSLITDIDVGLDNFTVTITFNEAVDTTKVTTINFDPVISSTLKDSTPSWSGDSTNFYMNYDVEDNNVEVDSIDIHVQYALTISDTLFDAFSIDTMNPTDTVFISDFSDPIDTGGHLNIEFYKNGTKGPGYFRLYYTEGYTNWPGNSLATIKDSIISPYDLSTLDETDYLVRIYWLDDVGNHSPNYAQAGPMQSIDNSNVYVGTYNTYEFGTLTYPYDTIQEGIDNVLNGGTVNVENITYSDSVIVNKSLFIKGIASSVYYINGDVTLDAKPITITDAVIQPPHSWYITENASIQDGIDAASHGDSIKVKNGIYTENININKTVNFSSVNGYDSTTIAASYTLEHVIKITADSVTFNGFSVYGAEKPLDYKAGIYLNSVENCNITNNRFGYYYSNQNDYGILVYNSNNNVFENNICSYNNFIGIYSENSNNNEIINNNCSNNLNYGMFITSNNYNKFVDNICNGNDIGIHLLQSNFGCLIGNITKYNDFNGINIRYFSNYNYLYDNTSKENDGTGLTITYNSKNNVLNNNLSELNTCGLQITESSTDNIIINNAFTNNNDHGIVVDNSDNNTLILNLSDSNTTFGLNIISSNNNNIYMNTFSNNSFPVNSNSSINDWNSPTEISYKFNGYSYHKNFLGNFYSDYSGVDSDEDGIGDSPYNLPGSEPNDNYPLILSSDNYIMQAWWLYADSIMYKNYMGKPLEDVTIHGNSSYMWISDQQIIKDLSFSASDTLTGQILFKTPPLSGNTFDIKIGYSTNGNDYIFCGPDTIIVGDGSSKLFTYKTDGDNYIMPEGSYYALKISNNNIGYDYDIVTGGGSSYISGPSYSPELYLNPSDSLNFGKVDTTSITDSTLTIIVKNIGNAELIIDSLLGLEQPFSVNFTTPDTIQVGDSTFIPVTLEREFNVGTYTDTLDIKDNCNNMSIIVTAQLTELTEPVISVIPDTVDFGTQAISAEEDSLSFVIKNIGTSKLIVSNFSGLTQPFSINYATPDTIYPDINDSSEIFITFDRSAPGYFIDTLWIHNNDVDTSIVVIGELTEPIISITPGSIDFGTKSATAQFDSLSFIVKNCGTGDLVIDGLTGLSAPFSVNYPIPDTIQPSDSSEIFIILDMSIPGSYIDTLLIYNNDKDTSLVVTAELTAPIIYLNPDFINFGSMSSADEYDSLSFVIKNIGTEDLTVNSIAGLSPPFSINYQTPDTIQLQDSSLVFIKLDKSVAGSYCDTLLIYNNDQDTSLIVTAEITAPIISLTPEDTLHFGVMDTTSILDSTKVILVKNIGTADLIINNLWGLSSPFSFYYDYPDTILPGDSTEIPVILERNFLPGLYCDTLMIDNNDINTSIIVTAELTEPIITLYPGIIDFGTKSVSAQFDSLSFVIKNSGTGNLVIDNLTGLAAPFSINYSIPDTIQPSDSSVIFIKLNMSNSGSYIDTLLIYNNDKDTSLVVTAELTKPIIYLNPGSIDFGIMEKSIGYDSLSFVVKNLGDGNLIIDGFDGLSEPFSVNHVLPDTINPVPNDSSKIYVKLNKNISGLFCDTLYIFNNDNDTSLIVTAEITEPLIAIIPDTIDFGILEMCSEIDSLPFIIKNPGNGDLIVSNVAGLSLPFSINYSTPDTIYPISDSSQIFVKIDKNIPGLYCDTLWIYNNATDTTLIIIANITEPPEPIIDYITDVPYDQGREVVINWFKSPLDDPVYKVITRYSIWRKQDWAKDPWEYIGFTNAHYFDEYAFIAPTISDSTEGNIQYYTFIVSAETTDPFVFYDSEPDSGYSVDNIAPNSVKNIGMSFSENDSLKMQWSEILYGTNGMPELNGIWYKVYGSEDVDFECNASTFITTTQDITFIYNIINKEKMFFKVITSDQPPSQK